MSVVMPALVAGIHAFAISQQERRGCADHRRSEATPFFGRLCPAMTMEREVVAENSPRHCEERSDEAIQIGFAASTDWIASLRSQ
jgi:hypothetical protein